MTNLLSSVRVLLCCLAASLLVLGVSEACTPAQRADVASAAQRAGPCLEACAPIVEELFATTEEAPLSTSLAFSVAAPPHTRRVLHRRCTSWVPVLVDAGADADASAK